MEVEKRLISPFLQQQKNPNLHKQFAFSGRDTSSAYILVSIFAS